MRIFHVSIHLSKAAQSRINTAFLYKRIFHVLQDALHQHFDNAACKSNYNMLHFFYVTRDIMSVSEGEHAFMLIPNGE